MTTDLSQAAQNLNWLITNFADQVPGVAHTVVVSADGLLLAVSQGFPRDRADQLAAVASGLLSLTQGASRVFEGGQVTQTVVEMERGFLLVMAIACSHLHSARSYRVHYRAELGGIPGEYKRRRGARGAGPAVRRDQGAHPSALPVRHRGVGIDDGLRLAFPPTGDS